MRTFLALATFASVSLFSCNQQASGVGQSMGTLSQQGAQLSHCFKGDAGLMCNDGKSCVRFHAKGVSEMDAFCVPTDDNPCSYLKCPDDGGWSCLAWLSTPPDYFCSRVFQ